MKKVMKEIQAKSLNSWITMFSESNSPNFDYYAKKFHARTGKNIIDVLNSMPYVHREVALQCIVAAYGLGHETARAFFTRKKVA
jgi:hypothetical protein